jgi:chromosome segregation ATPase
MNQEEQHRVQSIENYALSQTVSVKHLTEERDTLRAELAALTERAEKAERERQYECNWREQVEDKLTHAERENRVLARMVEDMALDLANHDAGHPYHRGASLVEQRIDCYRRDAEAELKGADHDRP